KLVSSENKFQEKEIVIRGRGIQAAFLNEISRLKGVDPNNIHVDKLWVEKKLKANPFKFGLDLQGGMNLVLEADFDKMMQQLKNAYDEEYLKKLDEKIKAEKNSDKKKGHEYEKERILDMLNLTEEKKRKYVAQALEIIRSRIDKTGVSEPLIRIQGNDKIEISLPGVASPEHAKKIISSTAKVEYRLAEPPEGNAPGPYTRKAQAYFPEYLKKRGEAQREAFLREVEKKIGLPRDKYQLFVYWERDPKDPKSKLKPKRFIVLEKKVALSGDDISPNTYAGFDPNTMQNTVYFHLTAEGTKKFAEITTKNKGRQLAILIDGKVRSAPNINEPILGGSAQISGSFTPQEAEDLALIIKEGALPVPMKIVEERSVGPTLGQESIEKGVNAILTGFMLVIAFMILYYHVAGLVATIVLFLNLLFMAALLAWMDFTITLPGLAGVVLTVGMAVDANVLIYERIREELKKGKRIKMAVAQGFDRATWTILDANITTLIAAIVLSKFGVGPIKGFAVTLFIGIVSSLFTSLYITKTIFYWMAFDLNVSHIPIGFYKKAKVQEASA
ncbi:MAG: protein translocase subunit SecD, partial [Candidatus Hydrogenedentota bacterium]